MKSAQKRIFPSSDAPGVSSIKTLPDLAEACYVSKRPYKKFHKVKPDDTNARFNPMNKQGELSRCAVCDSTMHWAKSCPHNPRRRSVNLAENEKADLELTDDDEQKDELVNDTFLTQSIENRIYLAEASGCAVIDTACTKTVCGQRWLEQYIGNLNDSDKKKIITKPGGTSFKFGDG